MTSYSPRKSGSIDVDMDAAHDYMMMIWENFSVFDADADDNEFLPVDISCQKMDEALSEITNLKANLEAVKRYDLRNFNESNLQYGNRLIELAFIEKEWAGMDAAKKATFRLYKEHGDNFARSLHDAQLEAVVKLMEFFDKERVLPSNVGVPRPGYLTLDWVLNMGNAQVSTEIPLPIDGSKKVDIVAFFGPGVSPRADVINNDFEAILTFVKEIRDNSYLESDPTSSFADLFDE